MTGRSSSPSNCRVPCIAISSPMPRFLRKSMVRKSSPPSLWGRCSHGSCRQIVHLPVHGVQRAVPVELVDGRQLRRCLPCAICEGCVPTLVGIPAGPQLTTHRVVVISRNVTIRRLCHFLT